MKTQAANRSRQEVLDFMADQVKQVIDILSNLETWSLEQQAIVINMAQLELKLDNATRRLGAAWFKGKQPHKVTLSYKWAKNCPEDVLFDTMRHELAHVAAGHDAHHGIEWQKYAVRFQASPDATYNDEWRPQLKYNHICRKCGKDVGGSDRKWRTAKQHRGCGGQVIQVPHGEDMNKVRPITVVEESPAGSQAEPTPQPTVEPPKTRKTASQQSKESKARQKAKNPELYNQIQSLASKVSRLKKDPNRVDELAAVQAELAKLRAEFKAL